MSIIEGCLQFRGLDWSVLQTVSPVFKDHSGVGVGENVVALDRWAGGPCREVH